MERSLLAISVTVMAFLATNLENQFILLAYLHYPQYSIRSVSVGYVGATGLILLGSYGSAQVTQVMPGHWIHYLGFLPIILGGWELLKLTQRSQSSQPTFENSAQRMSTSRKMMAVSVATLASGGDSFVVFTSLFADIQFSGDPVIFVTGIGMAALWVALAQYLAKHQWISTPLQRFGSVLLPLLLLLVGIFILVDTPIDID